MRLRHWNAAILLAAAGLLTPSIVLAAPKPTPKDLKAQLARLNDQAEIITEQYNGRREELTRAKRLVKLLDAQAARIEGRYGQAREAASAMAAATYMSGGFASPSLVVGDQDPRETLSGVALMAQLSTEQMTQTQDALRLRQQLDKARSRAAAHKKQVAVIVDDLSDKKQRIEKLVDEVKRKLDQLAPRRPAPVDLPNISIEGRSKAAEAARWAVSRVGKPYVWGAAGPDSFDCSGLMLWAYGKVGIGLPHYTGSQWGMGTRVSRMDQLQVGDIVFFYSDLHHNGMYIGNGMMVHAPQTGDVVRLVSIKTRPFMGGVRLVS